MNLSIEYGYAVFSILMVFVGIIISSIFSILFMSKKIGMWGVFSKAGEKEWKSIVPIYNQITLLKICKLKPWFIVFYLDFLIPVVGYMAGRDIRWVTIIVIAGFLVYRYMISIRLGQAYKKGDVFSFFMAFFPSVLFPVIGCSKNQVFNEVEIQKQNKKK